jgi:hypothetical protein
MLRRIALPVILLMGISTHAMAAATPQEAQRLTVLFQSYLGQQPGVVSVTPSADSYAARIDLAPHFAKIGDKSVSVSLSPIEWTITDQGGGKWKVEQDQQLSFGFKAEGQVEMKGRADKIKGTGIFDEALGAFASSSGDISKIGYQQTMMEAGKTGTVTYTIEAMHYESKMTGSGDNADGTSSWTFNNLRETIAMPARPDGTPAMDITITMPSGTNDGVVKGMKPKALLDLTAWLVARPSKEAVVADQAQLKDKLRAVLPLWNSLSATSTVNGLSVNTMVGNFTLDKAEVAVDMNGIVADGRLREKFTLSGLKPPPGIVPPWAESLVPQQLTLDFAGSGFDLAAPASRIIEVMDLSKDPPIPPTMNAELQKLLLPNGKFTFTMGPSQLLSKIFDLKAEGSLAAGPASVPSGSAIVSLKGIDEIMQVIQTAPPEMGMQQMVPMIIVAKGMGKQEADGYYSWKIESSPTGGVLINGVDPSKMGGQ